MRAVLVFPVLLALAGRGTAGDAPNSHMDIYTAAYKGNLKQVKAQLAANPKLLDKPAEPTGKKPSPFALFTPLQAAVAGDRLAVAKWLLEQGADANVPNESKTTALHLAVATWSDDNAVALVKLLLAHKAKLDARNYAGRTALHGAAGHRLGKAAKLLLAHGAAVGARDRAGLTPLHEAAWAGDEDMIRLLRKHGATPDTPLACYFGDLKRVRAFLALEPALASAADADGRSLLHYAVAGGHKDMVALLLDRRANPDSRTRGSGNTPLDWAVRFGRRDLAALLLDRGASVTATDKYSWTPLHRAVAADEHDAVWFDFPGRLAGGRLPASPVVAKDRIALVKLLLEQGPDVDAQTREYQGTGLGWGPGDPNNTPLHLAASAGLVDVATLLVDRGATVDVRNRDGRTALYAAVKAGHKEMVRFLLKRKANVNAVDGAGQTPLVWALKWKQDAIARLLREHGGKEKAPQPGKPPAEGKKTPLTDHHGDPLPPGAVARLGTLRWRNGTRPIRSLRFSPDGRTSLTVGGDQTARVWETATGKEHYHFVLPRDGRGPLSPDFRLLVTTGDEFSVCLWDTRTGKMIRVWKDKDYRFEALALAPDRKTLAAVGVPEKGKPIIRLWEVPGGRKLCDLAITTPLKKDEEFTVRQLSFLAGGKTLIALGHTRSTETVEAGPGKLLRWDVVSRKALPTPGDFPPEEQAPVISPDGKVVALRFQEAKAGERLRLLDLSGGKTLRDLRIPKAKRLCGVRFSPDGRTVVVVGDDGVREVVRAWEVASGKMLPALPIHSLGIEDVVFSPDGRRIAVQDKERFIYLCEVASGKKVHTLNVSSPEDDLPRQTGYVAGVRALPRDSILAFTPDGKRLAVTAGGNRVRLWDTATGKEIRPAAVGHEGRVAALAVSPDGKTVASVGSDGTTRLWDVATGRDIRALPLAVMEDEQAVLIRDLSSFRVAFTPDSRTIAVTSRFNTTLRLWDVATGKQRLQFAVRRGGVTSLAFTPDGRKLITGGDGRVLCWDAKTGRLLHRFAGADLDGADGRQGFHEDESFAVAVSPDGRLLAAMGTGKVQLRLWELTTGKLRRRVLAGGVATRMFDHAGRISLVNLRDSGGPAIVAFAPDGKTLAWNQGEAIELLDVARGRVIRPLGGRVTDVVAVAFSPAGGLLVIADSDGRVRFVDPATGKVKATFAGHRGGLNCLAFSPDGRTVFTGGDDTTVLVWDVARILEAGKTRPAPLSRAEEEGLWKQLASARGTEAAAAMARLQDVPREAVVLLRARLRPVPPLDIRKVAGLLADLESDQFKARRRATKELEQLEERVASVLRKRLAEKPPLEVRRRLEPLLERLEGFVRTPGQVRALRVVEVLEALATAEARELLRDLAAGAPEARLTHEAKAALGRLAKRPTAAR